MRNGGSVTGYQSRKLCKRSNFLQGGILLWTLMSAVFYLKNCKSQQKQSGPKLNRPQNLKVSEKRLNLKHFPILR